MTYVIKRIHLFWWRIPKVLKVFPNYVWIVFLKKHNLFYVSTDVIWKTYSSSYFSSLATAVYFPSLLCLYETNSLQRRTFHYTFIPKTCVPWRKNHFGLFLNANTRSGRSKNAYQIDYRRLYKSSHQRCSVKKGVLRNFAKFTGKHLCQSLFFNKVAGNTFFTEHLQTTASYSSHFLRYKCKITHCLDSQTLSEYISAIVLDGNEKLLIN